MSPRLLLTAALSLWIPACSEPTGGGHTKSQQPSSNDDDDEAKDDDAAKSDDSAQRDAGSPGKPRPSARDGSSPTAPVDAGGKDQPDASLPAEPGDSGASAAGDGGSVADAQVGSGSGACDRPCLLGFMQTFLDALVAREPTKLKVSTSLKYTDNGVVAKLGDGLWKAA